MYQLNFSDQSMGELNKLAPDAQMHLFETISALTPDDLENPTQKGLKLLSRDGRDFYRLRAGEYRIYFEIQGESLYSHYILQQHSVADFVFRTKLPVSEETLEQHPSFWEYLESLKK